MREAAPRPKRNPSENPNAPGGKSNARRASKCSAPVAITAATVTSVPTQRLSVIVAMESMRRYSNTTFRMPTTAAIASAPWAVSFGQM